MIHHLYLLALACFAVCTPLSAQYAINGQAPFGNGATGSAGDIPFTSSLNGTQRIIITTTNAAQRSFRLVTRNASNVRTEVGPSGCSANLAVGTRDGETFTGVFPCTAASFRTNGNTAVYVLKTPADNQSATFILWRLTEPVREVNAVTSTVTAGSAEANEPVTVTATLGSGQVTANGQTMYIRYSDDDFATSSVVSMANNGNGTFSGNIPGQQAGETVSYYVLTSASSTSNPVVTAANADLRTITFNNNSGSNYSYAVAAAPLPVTYTTWSARRSPAGVELQWSTATEFDAETFEVERSGDAGLSWLTVGVVPARNHPGGADYRFTDAGVLAAALYRLRQLDRDGTSEYSTILTVSGSPSPTSLQIWPQPGASEELRILATGKEGTTTRLYDAAGALRLRWILTGKTQGLPRADLPAGLYYLVTEEEDPLHQLVILR